MFVRIGEICSRWAGRVVPDPFVLALALTGLVFALGAVHLAAQPAAPDGGIFWTLATGWAGKNGFSSSGGLAFALQMCLVLVTGHAMALSPPVQRLIARVARMPGSAAAATALVAGVACASALIHWGLGAIAGALLAREIGRHAPARGLDLHYPLLGAAAYTGLAVWHGGLSGSAPLKVAEGEVGAIPLADTLLSPLNLTVCGVLLVAIPLLFLFLTPRSKGGMSPASPAQLKPLPERIERPADNLAGWIQESRLVGWSVGGVSLVFLLVSVATSRLSLDINTVNLLFLATGLLLQGGLRHYVDAITDGARGAGGIILQFPLYFGILGVMKASGLIQWMSDGMVTAASENSFPVLAFLSAGLVNMMVPSGGGQWAVQSEILFSAGADLGVAPEVTVMAFAYGDAWTNMLQPFWALPLLGIMGLEAKQIIGYTALVFLLMAVVVPPLLLVMS